MRLILVFPVLLFCQFSLAQPYLQGKTRHRFAQLNVGFDARLLLSKGSSTQNINASATPHLQTVALPNQTEGRFIIGGTHFWGHADFFIAIPLFYGQKAGLRTRTETGLKIYPWKIETGKIRPYIGASWQPSSYMQNNGAQFFSNKYPLTGGLTWCHHQHLVELGFGYRYENGVNYFTAPDQPIQVKTNPFWISLGYKLMLETTLSAEKEWVNGKTKILTDTLQKLGRLNGLTLAVGPSSSIFLKEYENNRPFLGQHKLARVFPEFGLGYYFHKPDLQFNLSYRNIQSELQAFGNSTRFTRRALSLEAYHFFADYHGFATFIGGAISWENLGLEDRFPDLNPIINRREGVFGGLVFGWDIRPNRLQAWYLRTNLRWFPNLTITNNQGSKADFDQLEFNFIQLVVFPGRMF